MPFTIRISGNAQGEETPWDGRYVVGYMPERGGLGELLTTSDLDHAHHFADMAEALEFWRQEHPNGTGGSRLDGKPNRPLTYFNVEISSTEKA